ncbi:MAG: efflux RND transporter periplasmic adaptor subunit [Prolixibacteraceae bacterium]
MKQIITFSIIALLFASCSQKATLEENQKKVADYQVKISKLEQKIEDINALDTTAIMDKKYLVKVQPIAKDTVARKITYTANIIPFEEIYLAPAAPGKIVKIYVEIGDRVEKGEKLVQMDQTQLVQAKIQMESLQKDYDRIKTLKESGSIAEQQYDQIKTQLDVTKTNVKFLEENTVIYAPFSGIITGKYFENGENYSGAPNTQAGKAAIVTLNQVNVVKAIINVSEQYYRSLSKNTVIELTNEIFADEIFKGQINNIYPIIDPLTRSFKVEVKVPNAQMKLRPGMYTRVDLVMGEAITVVVPAIAILQQEGTNNKYIFIESNGVAKRVDIEIGDRFNENIEIVSDKIAVGDKLIVVGQAVLMDGYKVKVVE